MCGIAGIVNLDGAPVERAAVERMTRTVAHRGPDAVGIWVEGGVGFGHRRLSIRDLSERGAQPMTSPGGPTVNYNGEIYNDGEIRAMLQKECGRNFTTTCDTEIIGPAYQRWGISAFDRFQGMFAIALWDPAKHELVLARDAVGIKPLYYTCSGQSIRFASELKALTALHDQPSTLDPRALHRFLGQGYPGPELTLLEGVRPLPPGCVLIADRDGHRIERYWSPKRTGEITDMAEALGLFEQLWNKIVGEHLVSDVPVGLLLSGGIDSALVAAALRNREDKISCYTAGFSAAEFNEVAPAEAIARSCGLPHRSVEAETEPAVERFFSMVRHYDGQCADSSGFAFHAVCEAAAKQHKVVLTGDGADEFFGGYETYRASRLAAVFSRLIPRPVARFSADLLTKGRRSDLRRTPIDEKLSRWLSGIAESPECPHPQWRRYAFPAHISALYARSMREAVGASDPLQDYADLILHGDGPLVDRCLLADQSYYLPGDLLIKSDAMSMAHGLEVRVPFLDRRIMEFAGRLDASLLTPMRGPDKLMLRQAARDWGIPARIAAAPKHGFNVPAARLLRTALKPVGDMFLQANADVLAPHLDPDGIRRLWLDHQDGRGNHGYVLWALLTLGVWRAEPAVGDRRSMIAA